MSLNTLAAHRGEIPASCRRSPVDGVVAAALGPVDDLPCVRCAATPAGGLR